MRSECATYFGRLSAEIQALKGEDGVSRDEFRILRDSIAANQRAVMDSLTLVREDVSALKVKASLWGGVAGLLAGIGTALLALLGR
jgi:hypothetical protein